MPTITWDEIQAVQETADIMRARTAAKRHAAALGFGLADQTRLATAVSELTRNVLLYAKEGSCAIAHSTTDGFTGITIRVEDKGPGIGDLNSAMQDGYSTSGGMGIGLPGSRRLMDHFDITSSPEGTCITFGIKKRNG